MQSISDSLLPDVKDKRILLIGGGGFIGHNLALSLKSGGADVNVLDGLQVNNLLSLHGSANTFTERDLYLNIIQQRLDLLNKYEIPLHVEDARDYFRLTLIFEKFKPQIVVFLAAVSHASRSNKDPFHTFDHSFRTLENALDCSRSKVDHFIYFSSSMVYGDFKTSSVNEETICNPIGIYGALKYGGEKLVIAYEQVFNMPYTIIRPSALYGERCVSRRVGQIFIENAIRGKDLIIKGDGNDSLDFTYIGDLIQGLIRCIGSEKSYNQVFNLTFGSSRTLNNMAEIIRKEFPGIGVNYLERDALLPERGTLDISKAKDLLGYKPNNSLEIGYPKYINWYKKIFSENNYNQNKIKNSKGQVNE